MEATSKPHAVFVPYLISTHISPCLKLAKLIHQKGFHITFVIPEYYHNTILSSLGPHALDGLPDFQFKTLPIDIPPPNTLQPADYFLLIQKVVRMNFLPIFRELVNKVNEDDSSPKVSCIVSDGVMTQSIVVGEELGIPVVFSFTTGVNGYASLDRHRALVRKYVTAIRDGTCDVRSTQLDTVTVDFMPGRKAMSMREFLNFMRTTQTKEFMNQSVVGEVERISKSTTLIFQSFDGLEEGALDEIRAKVPHVYSIAPLHLLLKNQVKDEKVLKLLEDDTWKAEDSKCSSWLDSKPPNSVLYISFGSFAIMSHQHLIELAWGIAASQKNFLWIIRPDMVMGDAVTGLPKDFIEETKDRRLIMGWCQQEQVLNHPAIGGFFNHGGWNSILESVSSGVPMICWPYFGEHAANSKLACKELEFGIEVNEDIKRAEIENVVKEIFEGETGKNVRKKAKEWMKIAQEAASPNGVSVQNLDKLVNEILLQNH